MADIIVSKKNESFINIDCEMGIMYELKEHFTFAVEGAKYTPKFKAKMWDGNISLLDLRFGTLPVGLFNQLKVLATKMGYDLEVKSNSYGSPDDKDSATYEDVELFILGLNLHSGNNKIEARSYQIDYVFQSIKHQRLICLSPTASGKSLILYCLYRWYLAKGKQHVLLVVPNLGLVKQMYSDFIDYSSHNGFDIEDTTQIVAEGADKKITKNLIISTWQSIYKQPASWFNNNIDAIMVDECHQYKADAMKGILEKATEVKFRVGVSGSLDKSMSNKMVLRGLIGEVYQAKTTRQLIDEGYLSDIKISCILLKYGKESKQLMKSADYKTEIDFLCQHEKRNKFIRKLALQQKGNTLVLFNYVEKHGEPLYEDIKKNATTQKVHFVAGKVEADDRERVRLLVQTSTEDNIVVASVGTFSTGTNVPRIHNIIFAIPTKSVIRVMQSIGRGLRKSSDKDFLKLFDVCDVINSSKSSPNHTMRHFTERLRIYNDEQHSYRLIEVEIE